MGTEAFFFTTCAPIENDPFFKRVDRNWGTALDGRPVHRIVTNYPYDVSKMREKYAETHEADFSFDVRQRIELGIRNLIDVPDKSVVTPNEIRGLPVDHPVIVPPRVGLLDIETDDSGAFSEAQNPTAPVISIAMWDSETDQYICFFNGELSPEDKQKIAARFVERGWKVQVVECKGEGELFSKWTAFVEAVGFDILVAWNGGAYPDADEGFDFPYLYNRAKRGGYAELAWKKYALFDLMQGYAKLYKLTDGELESKALNFVSIKEGLSGKIPRQKIHQMYEHDRATLIEYNCNDVFLMKGINDKKDIVNFFLELTNFAGCWLRDWDAETRLFDAYLAHFLKPKRIVQPTNIRGGVDDGHGEKIEGAKVFDTIPGIHSMVIELDNASEYVSIMRTFNMSPESIVNGGEQVRPEDVFTLPSGNRYRKEPRAILPLVLDEIAANRAAKKKSGEKMKENVIKGFGNAAYGCISSPWWRNRNRDIGQDITHYAQHHLKWNKKMMESKGGKLVLGDTDSTNCMFPEKGFIPYDDTSYVEAEAFGKSLEAELNASYGEMVAASGASNHFLGVKLEHVHIKMLIAPKKGEEGEAGKKRYACIFPGAHPKEGIVIQGPDGKTYTMKVRGFEIRRSNSAPITRKIQQAVIEKALFGASKEDIKSYLQGVVKDLRDGKISVTECRIPTAIKQENYKKGTPMHVRAAEWSNMHLGTHFFAGSNPCVYFGYIPGLPRTECFALEWDQELPLGAVIDWNRTLERVVFSPLETILFTVGLRSHEILVNRAGLGDAF